MYLSSLSLALNRPGAVSLEQVVASLFAAGEQGAWYDPSAANVTWRRNLLTYSEQFDNAAWLLDGAGTTRTANQAVAPDSTTTADRIVFTAASRGVYQDVTIGNGAFTGSYYVKAGQVSEEGKTIAIGVGNATDGFTDVLITLTSTWQRITATRTTNAGTTCRCAIHTYAGATARDVLVWGAQLERGTTPTPYQRIVTPEITYLADVQSQPLLFTDSTGAAPVTGVEQPVGLILDRRKGLALGPELLDGVAGTVTGTWAYSASNVITRNSSSTGQCGTQVQAVAGRTYLISFTVTNKSGDSFFFRCGNTASPEISANGTYTYRITASSNIAAFVAYPWAGTTGEATITLHSIRLLDGNHAYQTGSTARPVLRARYNLLTYSEQFDFTGGGGWSRTNAINMTITANAAVAPDGSTTAEKIRFDAGSPYNLYQNINSATTAGVPYTASVYLRADAPTTISIGFYDNGITRVSTANITTTWTRFTHTATLTKSGPDVRWWFLSQQNGEEFYAWGADLRVGTSAGDYQRIAAATDYATTSTITGQPFRPYLDWPIGNDDHLISAAFDLSANSQVLAVVGVGKYTNTNDQWIFTIPDNAYQNIGFNLTVPNSTNESYSSLIGWSAGNYASVAISGFAAPNDKAVSWLLDRNFSTATDAIKIRVNGVLQTASSSTAVGTRTPSNFSAINPIYSIGANGGGNRLQGRIFGIIIRGGIPSASQISAVENYMASKIGITL